MTTVRSFDHDIDRRILSPFCKVNHRVNVVNICLRETSHEASFIHSHTNQRVNETILNVSDI